MKMLCPNCGVRGSADDSYIGKKVKCPKCNEIFKAVPEEEKIEESFREPAPEEFVEESVVSDLQDILPAEGDVADAEEEFDDEPLVIDEKEILSAAVYESESLKDEPVSVDSGEHPAGESEDDFAVQLDETLPEIDDFDEPLISDEIQEIEEQSLLDEVDVIDDSDPVESQGSIGVETDDHEIVEVFDEEDETDTLLKDPPEESPQIETEKCSVCGKEDSIGEPFIAKDGQLFCTDCLPEAMEDEEKVIPPGEDVTSTLRARGFQGNDPEVTEIRAKHSAFTVSGVIKEAWRETKGAKASIWAGAAVFYLLLLILTAGATFLAPYLTIDPAANSDLVNFGVQAFSGVLSGIVSALFTAGLFYMGVRKVAGDTLSWKMIFSGFSKTGKVIVATLLQTILVSIGMILFIIPGIYLMIAYGLAMPLILDRDMGPWQALETSRKAIHKVWWKVAGAVIVMGLIYMVSVIPLGLGMIWTLPMSFALAGVIYRHLFGSKTDEQSEKRSLS
ncbi:hypothetical protein [Desulfomarina sp.]